MFDTDREPDFGRFLDTLLLRRAWRRPPQFDFIIDARHKAAVLGRPAETADDEAAFYRAAGYDYVQASVYAPHDELIDAQQRQRSASGSASHGDTCVIPTLADFRSKRWSWQDLAEGDTTRIEPALERAERLAEALPGRMKLLLHGADVFTFAWEMIGFDAFCLASYEEPEFIRAVMDSLAAAQLNAIDAALRRCGDRVGAIIYSDDIAYTEGLMLSPDFFKQYLFPTIGEVARRGESAGAPLIYHSDGRLYDVFDDLTTLGVKAIQPLEPKSMDPMAIKQRWPGRLCLLGHIDLDLMARGEPDQVEAHVRQEIDQLNADGGYMPGVSNTVPDYVKTENYLRMIRTIQSYPDELIETPGGVGCGHAS